MNYLRIRKLNVIEHIAKIRIEILKQMLAILKNEISNINL